MKIFKIKQFVSGDFCLNCLGCCRYNCNTSIWAPNLLEGEKRVLDLEKIKLITDSQSYICCFLNPESNLCRIYNQRPLECRLYPFLLNRYGRRLYLSLDSKCPFSKDKVNSKEFKRYRDYLILYLQKPAVLNILNKNLRVFASYPAGETLNLVELANFSSFPSLSQQERT